jgi:hypothetical protein
VAPIVTSIEIARSPEDVFAYVTDPSRLTEWQESLVGSRTEGGGPAAVGLEGHTDPPRRSQRTHDDLGDHGDQSPEDLGGARHRRTGEGDGEGYGRARRRE